MLLYTNLHHIQVTYAYNLAENLSVIWARHQYYEATENKQEKEQLLQDFTLTYQDWEKKSPIINDFHCVYLAALVYDETITQTIKDQATQMCEQANYFAYNSDTLVNARQEIITLQDEERLKNDQAEDELDEQIKNAWDEQVGVNNIGFVQLEEEMNEVDFLFAHYEENLKNIFDQYLNDETINTNVSLEQAKNNMHPQLLSIIDRLAYMLAINRNQTQADFENYDRAGLDFVVMTTDAFEWYASYGDDQFSNEEKCLLGQIITAYLNREGVEYDKQKQLLAAIETPITKGRCELAAFSLNGHKYNKDEFLIEDDIFSAGMMSTV